DGDGADALADATEGENAAPTEEEEDSDEEELFGDAGDDLDLSVHDRFQPGTMALSFFAKLGAEGEIVVRLPGRRAFAWQDDGRSFPVNGWYRRVERRQPAPREEDRDREFDAWARTAVAAETIEVRLPVASFQERRFIRQDIPVAEGCPLR